MDELLARVAELELRFTEQQRLLQDLSDVAYGQQNAIDLLAAEVSVLKRKLDAGGEIGLVDANAQEKPPHY